MKKSTVAISLIAIWGVVWTGSSWYTGKRVEDSYRQYVKQIEQKLNQTLAKYNGQYVNITINEGNFERGIFSSQVTTQVIITEKEGNRQQRWQIPIQNKIYHGPFPLNQLASLNFMPNLLAWHSEVLTNESINSWFEAANNLSPIVSDLVISYNQKITGQSKIADFAINDANTSLNWNNFILKYQGIGLDTVGKMSLSLDNLTFKEADSLDVFLENIALDWNIKGVPWEYIYVGKQQYNADKLAIKFNDQAGQQKNWLLHNIQFHQDITKKDDFIDFDLNAKIEQAYWQDKDLGEIDVNFQLNHLDAEAVSFLYQPSHWTEDPQWIEQDKLQQQAFEKVLQNQPHFILQPKLTNSEGQLQAKLNLALAENSLALLNSDKLLQALSQFDLELDFNKQALAQYISIWNQNYYGLSAEQAKLEAQQMIAKLLKTLRHSNLVVEKDQQLVTKLNLIDHKQIELNGEIIPEQQLQLLLLALMLGL